MGLPFENADYNEDEVGAKKIPELTDVVLTNIQNDNVLVYNNGVWENQAQSSSITEISDIPGVTITNVQDNQFLKYISGVWVNSTDTDANTDNLNDLTDTLLTTPFGDDEVLKYSGGKWKNGNIPIEKLSNVYISNLQDGETLRYVHQNTRWENAYNIDTLNELSDVTISSNLNNHVLKYNHTSGVYKNAYLNVTDLGDTNITTIANGNTLIYNNGEWSAGNITYTETDPVFTQSPAGSILDGTGFLKNNGGTWSYDTNTYLTSYTETDPVFTQSPAGSILDGTGFLKNNGGTWSYDTNVVVATASRVGTWDTAYGWGDHAAQNYITQANIYGLNGLTWSGVDDNELIRRSGSTSAEGAGMKLIDTAVVAFPQNVYNKTISYFNRVTPLNIQFGAIDYQYTIAGYNQRIIPYNPLLTNGTDGLYLHHSPTLNNTNVKVGINKAIPNEELDINGKLRIEADTTQTIRFYDTQGGGTPDEDGRIEVTQDGGGGEMKFYTLETGNGTPQERLSINRRGALGLTTNYGTAGQFLKTNGSGSAVSWGNALTGKEAPLYVDSTNNRVGINVALPDVEFEVGNTFNINDTSRRVGILNTNPTTTFQVGYTLNTNLTTERVGIGIVTPAEKLDVDSVIQITGQTATRASLYFSKVIAPEVKQDLAEITSQSSGTNGGDIEFWTADSGTRTKKITINEKGAIGIGATPDYGTTGKVLTTNGSGSAVSWATLTSANATFANSYLSGTYQDQSTPSTSTFYRVGHTTTFTAGAVSGTGIVNTSGEHKLTIPLGQGGVYKVDATIVMEILDSQGAVEWEGRMMRNVSGTITEIAYAQRHYTDYPLDGVSASALTWKNTIHLHKTLTLNEGDFIYLEQRNSGGNKTRYYGSSTGSRTNFSIVKIDAPVLPSGSPAATAVYGGAKITHNSISGTADLTGYYYLIYQGLQFVSTTKKVFVATYDGWYNLSWSMDARTAGTAYNFRFMYLNVFKNGVLYHETIFADDLGVSADKLQGVTNGGSVIIQLLATDYISFQVSSDSTNYGITGYTSLNKIDTTAPAPLTSTPSLTASFMANSTSNTLFQFSSGTQLLSSVLNNTSGNRGSFNIRSAYNTSTGLFTAPESGVYSFYGSVFWQTSSFAAGYVRVLITKPTLLDHSNALLHSQYGANEAFNANFVQTTSGILSLIAGDTIGLYVFANSSSSASVQPLYSYFCGHRV